MLTLILIYSNLNFVPSCVVQTVKHLPEMQETWAQSFGLEDTWRRAWQPTPVFLPGEFHGQRSLVCYSPWGHRESDMTEQLTHTTLILQLVSLHSKEHIDKYV